MSCGRLDGSPDKMFLATVELLTVAGQLTVVRIDLRRVVFLV